MKYLILLLTLYIFLESIPYGVYEFKQKNQIGGSVVIFLASFQLIFTNIVIFILYK